MRLYNTLTMKKEELQPLEDGKIKMYWCGPTVYNFIHIGNARPYIIFDTVRRYLEYKGYSVICVQNFTDVDDRIINRANDENVLWSEISDKYINEALKDADNLNVKRASHNPKATEEIDEIIKLIELLIKKGNAYESDGSVFFDTTTFHEYGKLSKKNINDLEAGIRVEVDVNKKSPYDFVLWKPSKPKEPGWSSPWGMGRPGWHIECSAMAKKYLGETIDIHAGGCDLVFPHHENEIAQSEAAHGKLFSKYWMHNESLCMENKKMSKSLGNFFTLREIAEEFGYDVVRFFMLSAHYRSPINFSKELLASAENGLSRIKNCLSALEYKEKSNTETTISEQEQTLLEQANLYKNRFCEAMDDDFNTADAVSVIFEFVRFANSNTSDISSVSFVSNLKDKIKFLCDILGIFFIDNKNNEISEEYIDEMINKRQEARKNKDFLLADKIRDELNALGIVLEDSKQGVRWTIKR